MPAHTRAYVYGLSAVLLWSTAATAFKLSLHHLHSLELQAYAVTVAVLVLASHAALRGKFLRAFTCTRGELATSALSGLLNPFGYYLVLLTAYSILPAQEALVLNYLWPIALAVLAVPFLKHPLTTMSLTALAISFGGVVVIGTRGDLSTLRFENPKGVVLAAGSSILWAFYWILNMKDRRDGTTRLLMSFLFGWLYTVLACALTGRLRTPPWQGAVGALYVGLFEMGVTFTLWLTALSHVDRTGRISNLVFLSPFLSLALVRVVLGEPLAPSTIMGFALILAGIGVQQVDAARSRRAAR